MMELARPKFLSRSTMLTDLKPEIVLMYSRTSRTAWAASGVFGASEKMIRSLSFAKAFFCNASTVRRVCTGRL
jgi:hypothetical protein